MNFAWNAVLRGSNPNESEITEETTTTARGMPDVIRCGPYAERSDGRGWNKQMARVVSGWWTHKRVIEKEQRGSMRMPVEWRAC